MQQRVSTKLCHISCVCAYDRIRCQLNAQVFLAIKTANSVSKETYSHSTESPVFGSGQGSTVSATGWGKLVSIALDMNDKQRFRSQYSDSEGTFKTIIGMLGFINNNNISNTGENMNR